MKVTELPEYRQNLLLNFTEYYGAYSTEQRDRIMQKIIDVMEQAQEEKDHAVYLELRDRFEKKKESYDPMP